MRNAEKNRWYKQTKETLWNIMCKTTKDHNIRQVNEKSCRLRMGAYRDGVKRERDKIGMGL